MIHYDCSLCPAKVSFLVLCTLNVLKALWSIFQREDTRDSKSEWMCLILWELWMSGPNTVIHPIVVDSDRPIDWHLHPHTSKYYKWFWHFGPLVAPFMLNIIALDWREIHCCENMWLFITCDCCWADSGLLKALDMIRLISTPVLFFTHMERSHWMLWSGSVGFSHASSSSHTCRGGGGRMNSGRKWPEGAGMWTGCWNVPLGALE